MEISVDISNAEKRVIPRIKDVQKSASALVESMESINAPADFEQKNTIKKYKGDSKEAKKLIIRIHSNVKSTIALLKYIEKHNKELANKYKNGEIDLSELIKQGNIDLRKEFPTPVMRKLAKKLASKDFDNDTDEFMYALELLSKEIDKSYTYEKVPNIAEKKLNCSYSLYLVLRLMGKVDKNDKFYMTDMKKHTIKNEKKLFDANMSRKEGNGKTVRQLEKSGDLKPGDMIFYRDKRHVAVYAGDGKFYDFGRNATTDTKHFGGHYIYTGKRETKYYDYVIYSYYRFESSDFTFRK